MGYAMKKEMHKNSTLTDNIAVRKNIDSKIKNSAKLAMMSKALDIDGSKVGFTEDSDLFKGNNAAEASGKEIRFAPGVFDMSY